MNLKYVLVTHELQLSYNKYTYTLNTITSNPSDNLTTFSSLDRYLGTIKACWNPMEVLHFSVSITVKFHAIKFVLNSRLRMYEEQEINRSLSKWHNLTRRWKLVGNPNHADGEWTLFIVNKSDINTFIFQRVLRQIFDWYMKCFKRISLTAVFWLITLRAFCNWHSYDCSNVN